MREVELKFAVSEAAATTLARSRVFKGAKRKRLRMHAIYFDTPDHRLAAAKMALRVRDEGGQWVQCLKAGHSGAAGLHARDEWEAPRPDASLDLAALGHTPLAQALGGAQRKLAPVFEVEMDRLTWALAVGRARVEVALDRGEVRLGRKRDRVCELEIESLEGDPRAVFVVAKRLAREAPLRPSTIGKAQRGYALSRPREAQPVKSPAIALPHDVSFGAAARATIAAALAQLQANESLAALPKADPEWLHQFRVGLRRLRAALRVFDRAFTREQARRMRADCRWLSRQTGRARDWDVLVTQALPGLLKGATAQQRRAATARAIASREVAHRQVRVAIESPRYTRFVLRFAEWLASPPRSPERLLAPIARKLLQRRARKAVHALHGLPRMTPAQRHAVRIRVKRLRYACEDLAPLFGAQRHDPYAKALAQLQDDLGGAADARVAMRLIRALRLEKAPAAVARSRLEAVEAQSVAHLHAHVRALRETSPFWQAAEN